MYFPLWRNIVAASLSILKFRPSKRSDVPRRGRGEYARSAYGVNPSICETLEQRMLLTITTPALGSSNNIVFNGDSATDTVTFSVIGGLLAVNGSTDLDLTTPGTQSRSMSSITSLTFNDAGNNDNVTFVAGNAFNLTNASFTQIAITAGVISIPTGTSITTTNGNISLSSNQGAVSAPSSTYGISLDGSVIQSTGSGTVTLIGTGGATGGNGVDLQNGAQVIGGTGGVSITGHGGNGSVSFGVHVATGTISANGNGSVTVVGSGATTSTGNWSINYGVDLNGTNSTIKSSGGNVSVTGTGGGGGTGIFEQGVVLQSGGLITAGGTGTVTVVGYGGNTTGIGAAGGGDHGVLVADTSSMITSSGGNVSVTGTAGGAGLAASNDGVADNGTITAGGLGNVLVIGQGGNPSGTGNSNYGVFISGAGSIITSSGGNVSITGNAGGANSSTTNAGVWVNSGEITAGGNGTVTVVGNGGNLSGSGSSNFGLWLLSGAIITSTRGNVSLTGTGGGAGISSNNYGLNLQGNDTISAGGTGTVTVIANGGNLLGTGSNNYGINFSGGSSTITSSAGNVFVTSIEGGGSNAIAIVDTGGTFSSPGGTLSISADSMSFVRATIQASTVLIQQRTTGVAINLGVTTDTAGGPLSLSNTELGYISATTLNLGNANTGGIIISAPIALTLAPGSNVVLGTSASQAISPITTSTGTNLNLGSTTSSLKFLSGSMLNIAVGGLTANTQYNQLNISGLVNLTDVSLSLSGSYVSTAGNIFTIVNGTAITGTFTGLANNTVVTFNGRAYRVNYTTTTVTLTDIGTAPIVTSPTVTSINATTAVLGGNVTSNGGASLVQRGVLYAPTSTNSNPKLGGAGVIQVNDANATTGVFSESVSGLLPNTAYSVVAFATGQNGTAYTNVTNFTTSTLSPTTASISSPTIAYNANGTVSVSLTSAGGIPTGTVSLTVDGGAPQSQTLSGGSATFSISSPSAGTHALATTYAAQGNFLGSTATGTLVVNQAPTTVSVSSPDITYNTDGSVTITVSSGAGTPSGIVQLSVDGATPTSQLLSHGAATFSVTSPIAGNHALSATYSSQENFAPSTMTGTLHVNQAATSTQLSAPDITYNGNGTVTVSVTSAGGIPSGTVQLSVDGAPVVTQSLSSGAATFTLVAPASGNHSLTATYLAQGNFSGSTTTGTLHVNPASTTVSVSASDISFGSNGSVTVTIGSAAGTPGGNVQLSVDGATAISQPLVNGSATFFLTSPSAGNHSLTATYLAQGNYAASSKTANLHVAQAATAITINTSAIVFDAAGNAQVIVTSTVGSPNGIVTLNIDNGEAMSQTLSGGVALFTFADPGAGIHTLNAAFAAQGNFAGSSTSAILNVSQAPTTIAISAPTVNYNSDGLVTLTVGTVGAPTPVGMVSLSVDGGLASVAPVDGSGTATFDLKNLSSGDHSLHAFFGSQGNYGGSSSDSVIHVNEAPTSINISAPTITFNANGKVTLNVTDVGPIPAGTIQLSVDGGPATSATLDVSGSATFSITSPSAGDHALHATFVSQGNFAGSSADSMLHVDQATTTVQISASTITYGSDAQIGVALTAANGIPTPSGQVTLTTNGGSPLIATLATDGTASFNLTGLVAGDYSLTASYAAQGNYFESSAITILHVNQAKTVTTTLGTDPFTYDGATKTGGFGTVVGAGGLSASATSLTYSGDQIDAGTYFVTAHYAGDQNHLPSDGLPVAIAINKASTITTTSGSGPFTYDGTTQTGGSGSVTGAGGLSFSATYLSYSGDQVNAGSYFVTAHYAGDANHFGSDGSAVEITINKATSTTMTLGSDSTTYDGTTQTGGYGIVAGAGGLNASASSLTYSGDQVDAGNYYVTAHYAGDANHLASDGNAVAITIDKASTTTLTAGDGPYTFDGTTHSGGSGTVTGAGGLSVGASSLTYSGDQVDAGTYYVTAHYAGDANHLASDGNAVAITIDKASTTTLTAGDGPFTFDGTTHSGGSGTVTGAGGLSVGASSLTYSGDQVDAGTYYVTAHYAGDANHLTSDGNTVAITIGKASTTTLTVGDGPFTFDGTTHSGGSGTVTGAGGLSVGASSLNYSGDQVNAGTYYVTAHYAGDANHLTSDGNTVAITIGKASTTTVTAGAGPFTFDGTTHSGGSGTVTGAGGLSVGASSLTYSGDQINAGTYYVTAHYAGDANHLTSDGNTVAITIGKASTTTVTAGAGPFTFDGTTHSGGSGTVTGAGGLSVGASSLTYSGDQINAGTYYVTAHYAGDANHLTSDGNTVAITIGKASTTTLTAGDGPFTFDGTTHSGGSGTVTGAGGLSVGASSLTYTGDQVDAGTYFVTAHYAGDTNHLASNGNAVAITISKATSTTVTAGAGPFIYDGTTHIGGSGTVTGAGGLSVSASSLTYSGDQINAGTYYVTAHYAGDANHLASNGNAVAITISKATSTTVTAGAGPFTYDGTTHAGGSGTATGAGGLSVGASSLTYSGDQIDAGTYFVTAHYAGDANHLASDGSPIAVTVSRANLPISVNSDLMLVSSGTTLSTPPAFTGVVSGSAFTSTTKFVTSQGDSLTISLSSLVTSSSAVGVYAIVAAITGKGSANYVQPNSGYMYVVSIGHDAGTGARNVSFWDNSSNATMINISDLATLDTLNLKNDNGTNFDPTTAAQLDTWLLANSLTVLKTLSVQLATMELNVLSGSVQNSDVVYAGGLLAFVGSPYSVAGLDGGGFITIGNLINLANNALNTYTTSLTWSNRVQLTNYLTAIENVVEAANNNSIFVQQKTPAGV